MLELNKWFFVLLANFLILAYLLNVVLFRPVLKIFKERDKATTGALDEAREMAEQRDKALALMKADLATAAKGAKETYESLRAEGLDKQRELLSKASAEAAAIAGKAGEELGREAEKARQALRADVERLSEQIVEKLVGV